MVKKGNPSPASLHGDTIVYNPKAVFVQEGDMAMDIVRQMPSVKVENGIVTVMGKEIKKTYVDGKLVFGRDPLNALNNLSATDVTQIREFDNKDSRKKLLQGEKVRIFNISTKSHLVNSFDTQLLESAGSNIGLNKSDTDSRNEQNYFADANYNSRVYISHFLPTTYWGVTITSPRRYSATMCSINGRTTTDATSPSTSPIISAK